MTLLASDKNNAVSEIHEFDGYSIFMRDDNIIHLQFQNGFQGCATDARNMVNTFKKIKGEEKSALLIIYEEDNMFSKEAREYISSDEVSEVLRADAMVIKGLALRIIGNGYLKINKPKRPTRLFNSKDAAVEWLKQLS